DQLEQRVEAENARLEELRKHGRMLKEEVDEEDIAQTVAKWTGIPVSRLLEAEVQKLVKMEERLSQRVIGQREAIVAVSNAVRRAAGRAAQPNPPLSSLPLPPPPRLAEDAHGPPRPPLPFRPDIPARIPLR